MPAKKVYGVSIGDRYQNTLGDEVTVQEFVTPPTHSKDWVAIMSDGEELSVKDLNAPDFRKVEE